MKNFWVSWYGSPIPYELHTPWWISGYRMDGDDDNPDTPTICAAVQAEDEVGAMEVVMAAHDTRPDELEWRFVSVRPDDWEPFNSRFPRAAWMKWPALASTCG